MKLIGCRIYFQTDQELYTFICNRIEEYDQQYEITNTGTPSLLRASSSFESFQKILEEHIKSDGIFADSLTWNLDSSTLLKISVIKVRQNENAAITISIQDASLTQNFLQLSMMKK